LAYQLEKSSGDIENIIFFYTFSVKSLKRNLCELVFIFKVKCDSALRGGTVFAAVLKAVKFLRCGVKTDVFLVFAELFLRWKLKRLNRASTLVSVIKMLRM
jgi:hypothetical protein